MNTAFITLLILSSLAYPEATQATTYGTDSLNRYGAQSHIMEAPHYYSEQSHEQAAERQARKNKARAEKHAEKRAKKLRNKKVKRDRNYPIQDTSHYHRNN